MLLKNKNAIIYGAGGAIGSAVAEAFAKEGAKVFLVGRTLGKLEKIAKKIIDSIMVPQFKEGKFFEGFWMGSIAITNFLEKPENKIK